MEAHEQALGIFADAVLKLALHIQQEALDAEDLDQKVRPPAPCIASGAACARP